MLTHLWNKKSSLFDNIYLQLNLLYLTSRQENKLIGNLENNENVAFIPTGGSQLKFYIEKKYLDGLLQAQVHIYDSDKPDYIKSVSDLNAENIVDYILPTENIQFDESFFAYKLKEDYSHDFFKNDVVIVKKTSESFNEISETSILFSNKVNKVGIGTIRKIYSENDIASYNSFIISVNYDIFAISNSKKNLPSQIKIYGEIKGIIRLMD